MVFRRRRTRRAPFRRRRPAPRRRFRRRTRGFRRGSRRTGYRRGGVVLLKTTVVHQIDLNPSSTAPAGNLDLSLSQTGGTPLPHNGAGYWTLNAIPSCQWTAYALLYEQVQFRGVKIVYPYGPQQAEQSVAPAGQTELGPVMHAFDADSAELEGYTTLLSRPNHTRRSTNIARDGRKEASMYMVPRTNQSAGGVAQAVISRKRLWFDVQNASIFDIPFYGYKWWVQPATTTVEPNVRIVFVTYYLAFRGPRGCDSAEQVLGQIRSQPNVASAEIVEDCGC